MFDSKKSAFCFSAVTSTVMSSWTHPCAFVVWMRSVAVICRFFFAAKSYVQNGFEVPTLSTGGVVRTGSCAFAGTPSRPRLARGGAAKSAPGGVRRTAIAPAHRAREREDVGHGERIPEERLAHVRQCCGARAGRQRRAAPGRQIGRASC